MKVIAIALSTLMPAFALQAANKTRSVQPQLLRASLKVEKAYRDLGNDMRFMSTIYADMELTRYVGSPSREGENIRCPTAEKPYVVAIIFAGRKDRMSLLIEYLTELHQAGHLQEIHFWDRTRHEYDHEYVEGFANQHLVKKMDSWLDAYAYYQHVFPKESFLGSVQDHCGDSTENTILVKVDDDIVFIDVPKFPAFIAYTVAHPGKFIVHANTINNAMAAHYQLEHLHTLGQMPEQLKPLEKYWGQHPINFELSGDLALQFHKYFIEHPKMFAWELPKIDSCIDYQDPRYTDTQGRISVNFFATRLSTISMLVELITESGGYDEFALTTKATKGGLRECIFTPFNVAHLSFGGGGNDGHDPQIAAQALPLYKAFREQVADM